MPMPTTPRSIAFNTTLRVEITRPENFASIQMENAFAKFIEAFKCEMENSIGINEDAMDRVRIFEPSGAHRYRRFYFIIEGEKEACNKTLELFASLPAETEIKEAIRQGKKLVEDLIQDSENAYAQGEESNAPPENLINIKNVKNGYALAENCLRRAGRSTF